MNLERGKVFTAEQDWPVETSEKHYLRKRVCALAVSLSIGTLLMGLKFYVYWLTDSKAVLSDALESIINVVASGFAMGSVILAAKPPDPSHPYGHGKIEYFSAGFEGALIVVAALGILLTAIPQIRQPEELDNLQSGLWLLLASSLVNLALGLGLLRVGKHTESLAILADAKHVLTDVYTSAGVLLGLFLVKITGWLWFDGIIACLVALNILIMGTSLIRTSFAGLMDASDPELLRDIRKLLASERRPFWISVHRLRAWRSGNRIYTDFHLILPKVLTLQEAHEEVTRLQHILKQKLAVADAFIHTEPCTDPECTICGNILCNSRKEPERYNNNWDNFANPLPPGETPTEPPPGKPPQ
jgi:cation diffusion facilitator family transporter